MLYDKNQYVYLVSQMHKIKFQLSFVFISDDHNEIKLVSNCY